MSMLFLASCGNSQKTENSLTGDNQTEELAVAKVTPIHLTKADFLAKVVDFENNPTEWKYLGDKPAVIDFYADWCGPCQTIAPYLEELATEFGDDIYVYKIDVDKEGELAQAFGIQGIPALLYVPMEGKPEMKTGAMSKDELKGLIESLLLKK